MLAHGPENSFPSDHTTFILTVGFALITTHAAPTWGKLVSISGALVARARIYLGLHFPVDMLASALIASLFFQYHCFICSAHPPLACAGR
jgi:undecaprenyl-diphosphatase